MIRPDKFGRKAKRSKEMKIYQHLKYEGNIPSIFQIEVCRTC